MAHFSTKLTLFTFLLFSLLFWSETAFGAYYEAKDVHFDTNWRFISKFCYATSKVGQSLNFTFTSPTNKHLVALLYLEDMNVSRPGHDWTYVYKSWNSRNYDCNNISNMALNWRNVTSGVPSSFVPVSYMKQYFWYFAIADCSGSSLDFSSYEVHMTNSEYGHWEQELSFDRWGIGQAYIAFFVFYIVLVGAHIYGCWQLYRKEAYHPLVKIITLAILLEFICNFFQMIHYSVYANDGVGAPALEALGNLINMGSNLLLMFVCILVAKGWAITSHYLSQKYVVLIVMSLFVLGYLILFIWDTFARDPALTLYFYESIPGICVLVLRFVLVGWFAWCLRDTLRLENLPERRNFYKLFGLCYSIWFILLPLFVFICSFVANWVRFKMVRGISISIDFAGLVALAYLLWPSRAQNYFTIRSTTQLLDGETQKGGTNYDL